MSKYDDIKYVILPESEGRRLINSENRPTLMFCEVKVGEVSLSGFFKPRDHIWDDTSTVILSSEEIIEKILKKADQNV